MKRSIVLFAAAAIFAAVSVSFAFQDEEKTPQQQLQETLVLLDKKAQKMTPEEKENLPAFRAILTRYYTDKMSLLQSEKIIAEALIKDLKTSTRGGSGKGKATPSVDDILSGAFGGGGSKPATKPTSKPPTTKPPISKPPVATTAPKKQYVPGVSSRPVFRAMVSKVGGNQIGVVEMSANGKRSKIVEIPAALPGYPVSRRASEVAKRMTSMQAKDRLWWATLSVGSTSDMQVIVKGHRSPGGLVLTADAEWAKSWGVEREQLATMVIKNIRTSLDSLAQKARGETPMDRRLAAAKLRMDADALFDTNSAEAEAKYLAAIGKDQSYIVPYNRLADLYMGKGQREKAKEILRKALEVPGISDADKAEVQKRLDGM